MEYKAPAKINLFLNVGKKRKDSFHDIVSIMIKVSLFDVLNVEPAETICVQAPPWLGQEENLVYRAATLFFKETSLKRGCRISLKKNIPPGTGLGGGSSDAAATLKALNEIYNTGLPPDKFEEMGARLGSDVNFFFREGGCLVQGRGEKITPLSVVNRKNYGILLVDPGINIFTKNIYKNYPGGRLTPAEELDNIITRYRKMQWPGLLRNDLQETVFKLYPLLRDLKNRLENWGLFPQLSGSGSFMFALSEEEKILESASQVIKQNFKFKTYAVKPLTGV